MSMWTQQRELKDGVLPSKTFLNSSEPNKGNWKLKLRRQLKPPHRARTQQRELKDPSSGNHTPLKPTLEPNKGNWKILSALPPSNAANSWTQQRELKVISWWLYKEYTAKTRTQQRELKVKRLNHQIGPKIRTQQRELKVIFTIILNCSLQCLNPTKGIESWKQRPEEFPTTI